MNEKIDWIKNHRKVGLSKLKARGHKLLDEYILLRFGKFTRTNRTRAYQRLAGGIEKKKRLAHFREMRTEEDVIKAIQALERMIENRKKKSRFVDEYADKEQVKKELERIKKLTLLDKIKKLWKKLIKRTTQ